MTEPTVIKETMSLLFKLWNRYPDQRLCQLLNNVHPNFGYFTQDADLLASLKHYHARIEGEHVERI